MELSLVSTFTLTLLMAGLFQQATAGRKSCPTPPYRAFRPDSNGCSHKFQQCSHRKWHTNPCPPGLLYDSTALVCRYPRDLPQCCRACTNANGSTQSGSSTVTNKCTKKKVCVNGKFKDDGDYTCPDNSQCFKNECKCNSGFVASYHFGQMSCLSLNYCEFMGQKYEKGTVSLTPSCQFKVDCLKPPALKTSSFQCVANSKCDGNGNCLCDDDYEAERDTHGLVINCKAKGRDCTAGSNPFFHRVHGEVFLMGSCSQICTCDDGTIRDVPYQCPANSHCDSNKCICDDQYESTGEDRWGNLLGCRPKVKDCTAGNDPFWHRVHGEVFLMGSCTQRCTCDDGAFRDVSYQCPANSHCESNKCVCDKRYESTGEDQWGNLLGCRRFVCPNPPYRAFQPDSDGCSHKFQQCSNRRWHTKPCPPGLLYDSTALVCRYPRELPQCCRACTDANGSTQSGLFTITDQCTKKKVCVNGVFKDDGDYTCPANSQCINNECKCNSGFVVSYHNGQMSSCLSLNYCEFMGQKYEKGTVSLTPSCQYKVKCLKPPALKTSSFQCVANSKCDGNGNCLCDDDYEAERDIHGLVINCKAKGRDCKFVGNPSLVDRVHGEVFLMDHCTQRCTCDDGEILDVSYQCPANSHCESNKCVCNKRYESTGEDRWGNLLGCRLCQ